MIRGRSVAYTYSSYARFHSLQNVAVHKVVKDTTYVPTICKRRAKKMYMTLTCFMILNNK